MFHGYNCNYPMEKAGISFGSGVHARWQSAQFLKKNLKFNFSVFGDGRARPYMQTHTFDLEWWPWPRIFMDKNDLCFMKQSLMEEKKLQGMKCSASLRSYREWLSAGDHFWPSCGYCMCSRNIFLAKVHCMSQSLFCLLYILLPMCI